MATVQSASGPHPLSGKPSARELRRRLDGWAATERAAMRRAAILGLLEGATVIGFAWGLSRLVTALWDGPREAQVLILPGLAVMTALLLRAALALVGQRLNMAMARRIVRDLRLDLMAKALAGRIDPRAHAAGLNALFEDTEALEGYYARFHATAWQARVIPVLVLGVIATQSWVGALILSATLVPFILMMALLGLSSAAESKRQLDALSRLSNLLLDRVRALPLILAFGDGPRQVRTVGLAASDVAERTLRVLKIAFVTSAVLEFFSALAVALIAVYCGFYLLGELPFRSPEPLSLATAFFVLALSPELYAPMRRLAAAYHDQQTALAAAERLGAITVADAPQPAAPLAGPPAIGFDGVTIGFADDPDHRIGPVSFTCTPGSVTCLAGPTGSGKTSLMRMILDGAEGITVGGEPVSRQRDLTGQIAYVSQSPPLSAGTLRDNLTLGNRDASESQILAAVATVGLDALVASRPLGLDTVVDERGSGLSGGERRRIGLARALLRPAPILLLDEPTADLDPASEAALIAVLPALFIGRTVIFTSHSPRLMALGHEVVRL